ncbi:alpha-ketoglutarate-dependent taurine dioxygenase [Lentinula raphanica]|nr:alpha-ketoglutarate-dependent taurine dioxygenase [Lentinula raphanica]KAJ3777087.1 alpha-ketoglutarate-dependent taurine dioxygenase [Lentinula raphanica]KAJ3977382.1 alpha-ketoglutarate-dependent taurine dioxygenase [Lentinula raphanica]
MSITTTMKPPSIPTSNIEKPISYDINIPYLAVTEEEQVRLQARAKYSQYLPSWDPVWFEPLPPFEFSDPALRADASKATLLRGSDIKLTDMTPRMGTVIEGLDLSTLNDGAKDELALLVSERKVVAFPAQGNFLDMGPTAQQQWMNYFGKLNYQPVSGSIKGHPGFHIIHRDGNKEELASFFSQKTTSCLWHQDVSYEHQPPGYVMLGLLEGPEVGGDTVFAATDEAYRRLSPSFRAMIDPIKAIHSSANMINHTRLLGGLVRKDPVQSVHPIVRVHPVTNERCLFINGEFITGFQGLKQTEYKALSDFLLNHIVTGHDFQARVHWKPQTIVIFDNRSTLHSAIVDYFDEQNGAKPRHIFRLAAMAEVPMPVA